MEIPENEYALKTNEPKIESNDNGTDEIEIFNKIDCGTIIGLVFAFIFFFWFPVLYIVLIVDEMRRVAIIDKTNKTLIIRSRGIIKCCCSCCSCCINKGRTYFLHEIKNVKIQVTTKDDPNIGFGKLYFINGYIYSQNDECETLFSDIKYTDEKYNKFVSFFQKYIHTIDEPLEMVKNGCNNAPLSSNDILNKPSPNDDAAMPISS